MAGRECRPHLWLVVVAAWLRIAVPLAAQDASPTQPDSPLDLLRSEEIPETERRSAEARNRGKLPDGLVAILGDSRWHDLQSVVDLAATDDGTRCVTASRTSLILWDLRTGVALSVVRSPLWQDLRTVAISGDSRMAAAGGPKDDVSLWELPEGRRGHRLPIMGGVVALSRDGRRLATADQGPADTRSLDPTTARSDARLTRIVLCDAESATPLQVLDGITCPRLCSLALNATGDLLAACGVDGVVRLWNLADRKLLWDFHPHSNAGTYDVQFAPDGDVVWALVQSQLVPIDVPLGRAGPPVSVPDRTTCFDFLPGGERVILAHRGLRILDLRTGQLEAPLEATGHQGKPICTAFAPGGQRIATGGDDGLVVVWNVTTRQPLLRLAGHEAPVLAVAWSPDGSLLASGDQEGHLVFWETATGRRIAARPGPQWVQRIAFDESGGRLAAAGADGNVDVWDLADWTAHRLTDPWGRSQTQLTFLPGSRALLTSVGLIDTGSGRFLQSFGRSETVTAASADGKRRIVRNQLRHLEVAEPVGELKVGGSLASAVFSPDGRRIAGMASEGRLIVWDANTGAEMWSQNVVNDGAFSTTLTFSDDGRYLAYPAGNGTVHIVRIPAHVLEESVPN